MQTLKIVLVGDSGVGKSQLSRCVLNKEFIKDSQSTVGMEFQTKKFDFEKCVVVAQLWDTAGQERFARMTRAYYKDAVGAILVYDVCNRDSLIRLETVWIPQLKEYGPSTVRCILVGNKTDKTVGDERDVSTADAREFAERHNLDFLEASALSKHNVDKLFRRVSLSIAKDLPDIKLNLELAGLPEGWMAIMPPEPIPELAEKKTGSGEIGGSPSSSLEGGISKTFSKSNSFHESPSDFRPIGIDGGAAKARRTSIKRGDGAATPPKPVLTPKVRYVNYWTGDEVEELPTAAADPGLLNVSRPPPPPPSPSSPEVKTITAPKKLSDHTFDDIDMAPTERSSSASNRSRSVSLSKDPAAMAAANKERKEKIAKKWCCLIL